MIYIKHTEVLDGKVSVVEIEGPLNSRTSPDFEEYINRLLEKKKHFILLNAAKLEYVSSEGIGLILFIQKKISENNGSFIIFNLPREIFSFYSLLGFDKIFRIAESRIEALQIMDRQLELREQGIQPETYESTDFAEKKTVDVQVSGEVSRSEDTVQKKAGTGTGGFTPFVVECTGCGALVRVKQSGDFLCPDCNREFTVSDDRTITFH
ncbi:MAG TPA: STAS domain-containing protein [Spirochaetota bacterium]|nr:STAS domain-containing protein [Spirochaetota bacterium]HPI88668.1 STAS domain-containing protein [Spirochaetota bacterium]HPR49109.1 STAS domain-containing protein [Spirochaetota bacterium]